MQVRACYPVIVAHTICNVRGAARCAVVARTRLQIAAAAQARLPRAAATRRPSTEAAGGRLWHTSVVAVQVV